MFSGKFIKIMYTELDLNGFIDEIYKQELIVKNNLKVKGKRFKFTL